MASGAVGGGRVGTGLPRHHIRRGRALTTLPTTASPEWTHRGQRLPKDLVRWRQAEPPVRWTRPERCAATPSGWVSLCLRRRPPPQSVAEAGAHPMKLGRDLTHVVHRDPHARHAGILHELRRNALHPLHDRRYRPGVRNELDPDQKVIDPTLCSHDEKALLMLGIDQSRAEFVTFPGGQRARKIHPTAPQSTGARRGFPADQAAMKAMHPQLVRRPWPGPPPNSRPPAPTEVRPARPRPSGSRSTRSAAVR